MSAGIALIWAPLGKSPHPKVVLVVYQQFLQTGFSHIDKFQLRLARGGACRATLGDILLARPRRLHHLVDSAVTLLQEPVREKEGDIVDALRLLIDYQRPIVAPLGQEGLVGGHSVF